MPTLRLEGVKPALQRKYRETPPNPPKLDGKQEAHLIAICCSDPPAGRVRWTMQLLAKELVARKIIISISRETIRNRLNQIELHPWKTQRFCIPEEDLPRFIAQMEDVLDVYSEPPDPDAPLICMDEASVELTGDRFTHIFSLVEPLRLLLLIVQFHCFLMSKLQYFWGIGQSFSLT